MVEELNFAYTDVYTGKAQTGKINAQVSLNEVYSKLSTEMKSHIYTLDGTSTISLVDSSQSSITLLNDAEAIGSTGTAGQNTISVEIHEERESTSYYLESDGIYYPMCIRNFKVELDEENASTTQPTGAGSLGSGIEISFIDEGETEEKSESNFITASRDGTTITITAKANIGTTQVVLRDGDVTLTGNIEVTVNPTYTISLGTMTNGSVSITTNNIDTTSNTKYGKDVDIILTAVGTTTPTKYIFEKWNDESTTNPRLITVSSTTAGTYTASFPKAVSYFKQEGAVAYYYPADGLEKIAITASNMGEYLGRTVEYTPGNAGTNTSYGTSVTYRLFYVDVGTGTNGKYGDGLGTIYLKADCDTKTANMNSHKSHSSSDSRAVMKKLNPGMGAATYNDSHDYCVAWMTDPTQWLGWKDMDIKLEDNNTAGSGINYVVGGPSLEMYVDSYNAYLAAHTGLKKNGTNNLAEELACKYTTSSSYNAKGYRIGFKAQINNADWVNIGYYQDYNSIFSYDSNGQQMYNPGSNCTYWLASPSAGGTDSLMNVFGYNSRVINGGYSGTRVFCPLVSIRAGVSIKEK